MNYYNLLRTLKSLSNTHSLVNDYGEGDVYEYMNSGMHKYPCVFMTMQNITSDSESTNYNFTLFYIDRLISDGSNKINVQSIGVQVIKQILSKLFDIYPEIEISSTEYTPFTEKFADDCAGGFCQISLTDELDAANYEADCVEQNFETKELTIKENGIYEVLGYDKVIVSIDGGDCPEVPDCSEYQEIIAEQTTTIENLNQENEDLKEKNAGWQALVESVTTKEITENGTYRPEDGVLGWYEVTVNVPATDCPECPTCPDCPEGPDCSEYQEIIAEQTATIENLGGQVDYLTNQNEILEVEISEKNSQITNLQQNVDTLTSENQYLESENQQLETENNELATEVEEKDTQISELNGQIATVGSIEITENGTYYPEEGKLGWNEINVNVSATDCPECPTCPECPKIIKLTQEQYDALEEKDPNTIYIIIDALPEYHYAFINWDDTTLQEGSLTEGETPEYTGETPTRPNEGNYTYEFVGWEPEPGPLYTESIYRAMFNEIEYDPDDLTLPYVTFKAEEAGSTFGLAKIAESPMGYDKVEYSTDKTTWTNLFTNNTITLANVGDEVYVRISERYNLSDTNYTRFKMTGKIAAYGNVMALLDYTDLNVSSRAYGFFAMFQGCTALTRAPKLPATTLAERCYKHMFNGCTSLVNAPELPATTLANYCYHLMFADCTSLVNVPELPATTLAEGCYHNMFSGCTLLNSNIILPAEYANSFCYTSMFRDCTSLKNVKIFARVLYDDCFASMFEGCTAIEEITCLAEYYAYASSSGMQQKEILNSGSDCFQWWLSSTNSTGTFYRAPGIEWPTGGTGIPSGWTVLDYAA